MASRFQQILGTLFARDNLMSFDAGPSDDGSAFSMMGSYYRTRMELGSTRMKRYKDYRDMAEDTLISGALDLYADEATQRDHLEDATVWVDTHNEKVDAELRRMFEKIGIEEQGWGIARQTAKDGDFFLRPLASKNKGVIGMEFLDAEDVERVVDRYTQLVGFRVNGFGDRMFDPWAFIHFRILGHTQSVKNGGSLYGTSMLENARRTWRQLSLLEDTLIIYRLEIGGRHRIFYIDVGGLSHEQSLATVRRYQRMFGKKEFFNPQTGEWTSRFNPLNLTADIFWPIRKDSQSRIEYLGTDPNVSAIADVDYFRDKLFASLRVPKAYIGGEEYSSVRFGLSQVDISFARLTKRLQRSIINGLTRLAQIHLAIKEIKPLDPENAFDIVMTSPSSLDQEQRMEALEMSLNLAMKLKQVGDLIGIDQEALGGFITKTILGLSPYDLGMIGKDHQKTIAPGQDKKKLTDSVIALINEDPGLAREVRRMRANADGLYLPEEGDGHLFPTGRREAAMSSLRDVVPNWDEEDSGQGLAVEISPEEFNQLRPNLTVARKADRPMIVSPHGDAGRTRVGSRAISPEERGDLQ